MHKFYEKIYSTSENLEFMIKNNFKYTGPQIKKLHIPKSTLIHCDELPIYPMFHISIVCSFKWAYATRVEAKIWKVFSFWFVDIHQKRRKKGKKNPQNNKIICLKWGHGCYLW